MSYECYNFNAQILSIVCYSIKVGDMSKSIREEDQEKHIWVVERTTQLEIDDAFMTIPAFQQFHQSGKN